MKNRASFRRMMLIVSTVAISGLGALSTPLLVAAAAAGPTAPPASPGLLGTCAPASFDPLTASAASLLQYGFPARPSDAVAAAAWTQAMLHAQDCVTVPLESGGPIHAVTTKNYAGYEIPDQYVGSEHFVETESGWVQPSVPGNSKYSNYQDAPDASFWSGMGVNYIIQSGCDSIATATPTYKCWIEDYGGSSSDDIEDWGLTVSPGDEIYDGDDYLGNGYTDFFIENESTDQYWTPKIATPWVGYGTADFINEWVNYSTLPFPDYGSTSFFGPNAGSSDSETAQLSSSNGDELEMTNGTYPGAINNDFSYFYVYWG
jgi:hypothetical protein